MRIGTLRGPLAFACAAALAGCSHARPLPGGTGVDRHTWTENDSGDNQHDQNACKLDLKVAIDEEAGKSVMKISARNFLGEELLLNPYLMKIQFSNGETRLSESASTPAMIHIAPDSPVTSEIPLEGNTRYSDHRFIQITAPVESASGGTKCEVHLTLLKDVAPPSDPNQVAGMPVIDDETTGTRFDFLLGIGSPLVRSSSFNNIGGSGPAFEMMGTYNFTRFSGLSLIIGMEGITSSVTASALTNFGALNSGLQNQLLESYVVLGYTGRVYFSEQADLRFTLGPGIYYIDLSGVPFPNPQCDLYGVNCTYVASQDFGSTVDFALFQQLAFTYRLSRSDTGLGISLYNAWIPSGSWNGMPLSGYSFGSMVFFTTKW